MGRGVDNEAANKSSTRSKLLRRQVNLEEGYNPNEPLPRERSRRQPTAPHLEALLHHSRNTQAFPSRKGGKRAISAQALQLESLRDIYSSGYISYLAASGWRRGDRGYVHEITARDKRFSSDKRYFRWIDMGLALGFSFSLEKNGENLALHKILFREDVSALKPPGNIILEHHEIDLDLGRAYLPVFLGKMKFPFIGKKLLPPPGFPTQDVDQMISLLKELDFPKDNAIALRNNFLLGLWTGLVMHHAEREGSGAIGL